MIHLNATKTVFDLLFLNIRFQNWLNISNSPLSKTSDFHLATLRDDMGSAMNYAEESFFAAARVIRNRAVR